MRKNFLKYLVVVLVILVAGYGFLYWQERNSVEYKVKKEVENLRKQVAEDPYGGDTPEETLRLFVEALKQGDTELAAKYFVLEEQDKWKIELSQIKDKNLLDEMVKDLERPKYKYDISDKQIGFDIANDQKEAILSIALTRTTSGRWKVQDL